MAPTIITGDLATDTIASGQKRVDMDNTIAELEPNNAPFIALMRRLRTKPAMNPRIDWLEDESMPRLDTFSASATSAATALAVTNASYFRVGDGARILETGEFVEVTGVSAAGIGVNRAIGNTAAASATSAAAIYIINNANAEGASMRTIKTVKLAQKTNYEQIIRTPFGVTGTELSTGMYGQYQNDRVRLQHKYGMEHDRQIESTSLWGASKEDLTTAGAPKRWAGGVVEYVTTNVTSGVGTLTRATFETFLRSGFRYGSDRKVLLASPLVMGALDGFAWGAAGASAGSGVVQYNSPANSIGVAVKTYISSQGIVDVIMKRHWNDNATLSGYAFLLDLDAIWFRPLRNTKLLLDRQANDADKVEDEYLTECSFEFTHERRHAILKGVTA